MRRPALSPIALSPLVLTLIGLLAACAPDDRATAAAGDSPRCELSRNAGGCRVADHPRPDDAWRTSGFGGY